MARAPDGRACSSDDHAAQHGTAVHQSGRVSEIRNSSNLFAQIIGDNACDAIVVDAFSNPGPEMIRERFLPFVAAIRCVSAVPLIFLYRFTANEQFRSQERAREEEKLGGPTVFEEAANS